MQIWQRRKSDFFWKCHLEKWILKNKIYKVQVFSRFWVKIPRFSQFLSKFQAFSRPGKVNDKIPGFQGFPGRVGTLIQLVYIQWKLFRAIPFSNSPGGWGGYFLTYQCNLNFLVPSTATFKFHCHWLIVLRAHLITFQFSCVFIYKKYSVPPPSNLWKWNSPYVKLKLCVELKQFEHIVVDIMHTFILCHSMACFERDLHTLISSGDHIVLVLYQSYL